jgi:hypothetical protein
MLREKISSQYHLLEEQAKSAEEQAKVSQEIQACKAPISLHP